MLEENKEKSLDDLFPQIPSTCYLNLLNSVNQVAYEGFGDFLKIILVDEIDSMSRRSISMAKEKLYSKDNQKQIQKNLNDLIDRYLREENKMSIELDGR